MARQKTSAPALEPKLTISKAEAQRKLDDRLAKGRDLLTPEARANWHTRLKECEQWTTFNESLLRQMFTTDALAQEYNWSTAGSVSFQLGTHPTSGPQHSWENVQEEVDCLESIANRLELYVDPKLETTSGAAGPTPPAQDAPSPLKTLERLADRFHLVARQLRDRSHKRVHSRSR